MLKVSDLPRRAGFVGSNWFATGLAQELQLPSAFPKRKGLNNSKSGAVIDAEDRSSHGCSVANP